MTNQDIPDEPANGTSRTLNPDEVTTATEPTELPVGDSAATEPTPHEADAGTEPASDDPLATMAKELNRWKDLALRSQADFDNFRKRTARDITEIRRYAASELLSDLLPLFDNFDLGLMAAKNDSANSSIYLGMSMVRRQLDDFLSSQGVKEIPTDGEVFDPTKHDAVATEAHPEIPEGTIVRVARKGYFLHDRVLRAPSVVVSSGPATGESPESTAS